MTADRAELGKYGEDAAARLLESKGMRIVGRRVRVGRGELDIIARNGKAWVFVEVRTRKVNLFLSASESLGPRKAFRMARAVKEYLHVHGLNQVPVQCDMVAVDVGPDNQITITHYPNFYEWRASWL